MLSWGTQRTLALVSCASATQTPACAAATTSGRASESLRAAAKLIGSGTSVASKGAGLSAIPRSSRGGAGRGIGIGKGDGEAGPPWVGADATAGGAVVRGVAGVWARPGDGPNPGSSTVARMTVILPG